MENKVQVSFSELMTNETFIRAFQDAETLKDIQEICEINGVKLDQEDVKILLETMYASTSDDELDDEALEAVSGGVVGAALALLGGVAHWAAQCQNKNSNEYKATYQVVDFWYKKGRKWGWWR